MICSNSAFAQTIYKISITNILITPETNYTRIYSYNFSNAALRPKTRNTNRIFYTRDASYFLKLYDLALSEESNRVNGLKNALRTYNFIIRECKDEDIVAGSYCRILLVYDKMNLRDKGMKILMKIRKRYPSSRAETYTIYAVLINYYGPGKTREILFSELINLYPNDPDVEKYIKAKRQGET